MKKLRHLLEYAGLCVALFILDSISLRTATRLSELFADCWFRLGRKHRSTAIKNILLCGLATDEPTASHMARRSFRHFAALVVESLKSEEFLNDLTWRDHVEMEISPAAMELLSKPGKGVLLLSGHLGNWEIAAHILSFIKPVVGVTRSMNNPYSDQLVKKRKPRHRFTWTRKRDADIKRMLTVLMNGNVLALLVDQHTPVHSITVNFFGHPVHSHRSPALLHFVTGTPMIFGYCVKTGPLKYKLAAIDPIVYRPTGRKDDDIRSVLELLNRHLEAAIRQYPEQYLWAHRRWRGR